MVLTSLLLSSLFLLFLKSRILVGCVDVEDKFTSIMSAVFHCSKCIESLLANKMWSVSASDLKFIGIIRLLWLTIILNRQ